MTDERPRLTSFEIKWVLELGLGPRLMTPVVKAHCECPAGQERQAQATAGAPNVHVEMGNYRRHA